MYVGTKIVFNKCVRHGKLKFNERFIQNSKNEDAIFQLLERVSSAVGRSRFTVGAFCELSRSSTVWISVS